MPAPAERLEPMRAWVGEGDQRVGFGSPNGEVG